MTLNPQAAVISCKIHFVQESRNLCNTVVESLKIIGIALAMDLEIEDIFILRPIQRNHKVTDYDQRITYIFLTM